MKIKKIWVILSQIHAFAAGALFLQAVTELSILYGFYCAGTLIVMWFISVPEFK
jgi:hypothetical protein